MSDLEVSHDQITLEREIGQGEFGVVMKATASNLPHCEPALAVAVKIMRNGASQADVNAFIREGMRLRDLDHGNVVLLLGACLQSEPYYIILEYMSYGDLKTLLRQCKTRSVGIGLPHLMSLVRDVSLGFGYLQRHGFVHRDIAARNVLVSGDCVAKIGDFGMARRMYNSEYYAQTGSTVTSGSMVLPMRWMAPESYFDSTWDLRSDVWMFGVLLWGLSRSTTATDECVYSYSLTYVYRDLQLC